MRERLRESVRRGSGLGELFTRSSANPLLTAGDWPYGVNAVFNPGAAVVDGQTVLVCRVEDRRGISHLTVARSPDGFSGWSIDSKPLIEASAADPTYRWGVEDPRITRVDELGTWLIAYTAYGPEGPCVALASTEDFHDRKLLGVATPPEDKNASLFPRRVDGRFMLVHRPSSQLSGHSHIWLSHSADLQSWHLHGPILRSREGAWWDSARVGMGPPLLETRHGWLGFYHGVKTMVEGPVYRVGVVLLDLDDPSQVLRRSEEWVLGPSTDYERCGDAPNVVFPTGLIHEQTTDELRLYYGAADTVIAVAVATLTNVLDFVLSSPAPTR